MKAYTDGRLEASTASKVAYCLIGGVDDLHHKRARQFVCRRIRNLRNKRCPANLMNVTGKSVGDLVRVRSTGVTEYAGLTGLVGALFG